MRPAVTRAELGGRGRGMAGTTWHGGAWRRARPGMEAVEGAAGGGASGAGRARARGMEAGATWHGGRHSLVGRRARAPPTKDGQGGGSGLGLERGIVPASDFIFYLIPVVLRVDFSKPRVFFCKKA